MESTPDPAEGQSSSVSDGSGFVRKKHRLQGERICRVCGDKAVAHNFDVITCESCKTFFRRNAYKQQKPCTFTGNCEITLQTRRFCPACRLKKCLNIGMRADMILDEAERQARLEKIAENRRRRQEATRKDGSCSSHPPTTSTTAATNSTTTAATNSTTTASSSRSAMQDCIPDSSKPELDAAHSSNSSTALSASPEGSHNSANTAVDGLSAQAQQKRSETQHVSGGASGNMAADNSEAAPSSAGSGLVEGRGSGLMKTLESRGPFQHVPTSLLPSDTYMYWRLTTEEHTLITQLTVSYKDTLLQMPTTPEGLSVQISEISLQQTLGCCQLFPRQMVQFVKTIPDFRSLELRDQMAASKFCAMLIMMLKSSALFCEERDSWIKEFGELSVATFARVTAHEEVVRRYAAFCRHLKRILKNDYSAYALLNCLVLFDPLASDLLDRQAVNSLHDKYAVLLKHYLESQLSYMFAPEYLAALQDSVVEAKMVAVELTAMFNGWKSTLDPLMVEVMNLV